MAVDTRNKRASVLGIGLAAALVLPAPDGTVEQSDRQHVALSYAGLDATVAFTVPTGRLSTTEGGTIYSTRSVV